jgi:hypothetical protein
MPAGRLADRTRSLIWRRTHPCDTAAPAGPMSAPSGPSVPITASPEPSQSAMASECAEGSVPGSKGLLVEGDKELAGRCGVGSGADAGGCVHDDVSGYKHLRGPGARAARVAGPGAEAGVLFPGEEPAMARTATATPAATIADTTASATRERPAAPATRPTAACKPFHTWVICLRAIPGPGSVATQFRSRVRVRLPRIAQRWVIRGNREILVIVKRC